jgi:hypothetical protein
MDDVPDLSNDEESAIHGANNPTAANVFATMADVPADELTSDELAAIQGADNPTAANVFATMADVVDELTADELAAIQGAESPSNSNEMTTRSYVDSYFSGSLTDGAPTDAEIDAITGLTPIIVGANRKFLIKDTDGTELYYDIISNGVYWIYFPGKTGTTAL